MLFVLLSVCLPGNRAGAESAGYSPGQSSFSVHINKHDWPYRIGSIFVLPGEDIICAVSPSGPGDSYSVRLSQERIQSFSSEISWKAPQIPGLYVVSISKSGSAEVVTINVFVMVPFDQVKKGRLNEYLIGEYPNTPLKGLSIYKPPKGFIEVTEENENVFLSPHFQLKQFLCKQESGYPKYIVLRERLLLKLELLLKKVNEVGITAETLFVMSGYRTPFYNRAIGNVKYSRHLWGGAADIYVDQQPKDGYMDDLNKDGVINYKDAEVLYDLVDNLFYRKFLNPLIGGLGLYRKTNNHGPYIHIDVRGTPARWGD